MRAGLVVIGPLIPILKSYFNLSNAALSVLAGIPIACYAGTSLVMSKVAKLGSSNRIIKMAILGLTIGLIGRILSGAISLFAFTVVMGISIAIMNYELPVWVKEHAASRSGIVTGIYTTLMGLTSGLAVAISVPLAEINSLSWRLAMAPWAAVAIITCSFWWIRMKDEEVHEVKSSLDYWNTKAVKDPIAWALVAFFGFESMTFYATATWFPTLLTTKGFTLSAAALAVSISGVIGSLIGLMVPHYIQKLHDKRLVFASITAMSMIGFAMVALQTGHILFIWLTLSNIGLSCVFPIVLMLTGEKSNSPEETRSLSTMMQSIGYAVAAFGPFLMGQIYEFSNSWNVAMLAMASASFLQMVAGIIAAKPRKVNF